MGRIPSLKDLPTPISRPIIDNDIFEIPARKLPIDRFEMTTQSVGAVIVRGTYANLHDVPSE